jgi:hypothetical protein
MDTSSIQLPGSEIERIELLGGELRIAFSRAYIIKTLTGSVERTRWWQAGTLILEDAEVGGHLPQGPLICIAGDGGENIYTYRDLIPIPFQSRGWARCELRFQETPEPLVASARAIRLELRDVAKYIEHIRPAPT